VQVKHPNVVFLEDVFVSYSGNLYLVFELLDQDLKQYLDHGLR
jgi:serine/threonine protein kinase